MLKVLIGIALGILSGFSAYALLGEKIYKKILCLRTLNEDGSEKLKKLSEKTKICVSLVTGAICSAASLKTLLCETEVTVIIRVVFALYMVSLCAVTDFREHRIPNAFTALLALGEFAVLAADWILGRPEAAAYTFSAVFSCLLTVILMSLAAFLSKGGLGLGDIKLLAALAFAGDIYLLGSSVLISVLCCSAVGILLIILKKRSVKDGLPYAPFLFIGLAASVFMNLY